MRNTLLWQQKLVCVTRPSVVIMTKPVRTFLNEQGRKASVSLGPISVCITADTGCLFDLCPSEAYSEVSLNIDESTFIFNETLHE